MDIQAPVERKLRSANLLVTSEIMAGFSATDVVEAAGRWRADCVFIGAEKTSLFEKLFSGGLVASVAARAECSVEFVRSQVRIDAGISEFVGGARHNDYFPVAS
jgi:nucleotide-binding universal stress UspA family protein